MIKYQEAIKIINKIFTFDKFLKYNSNYKYYCNVVLANDFLVKKLNKVYKKQNNTTDVLTFISNVKINSVIEKHCDIIVSANRISYDSNKKNINFYDHFTHLIIHGILHTNGYSHNNKKNFLKMKNKEVKILSKFGIPDPYL